MVRPWGSDVLPITEGRDSRVYTLWVVIYSKVMESERPPASRMLKRIRSFCIEWHDEQVRRVGILCENSGSTVSLMEGRDDGIVGCNRSHIPARPTEKIATSSSVPIPNVGWSPVVLWSIPNRLRLIIGSKRVDPDIEAQAF